MGQMTQPTVSKHWRKTGSQAQLQYTIQHRTVLILSPLTYFLVSLQFPFQMQSITALLPIPNYTAWWWQRHMCDICVWTTCPESINESGINGQVMQNVNKFKHWTADNVHCTCLSSTTECEQLAPLHVNKSNIQQSWSPLYLPALGYSARRHLIKCRMSFILTVHFPQMQRAVGTQRDHTTLTH